MVSINMFKKPVLPSKPPEPKQPEDIQAETSPSYKPTEAIIYRQEFERAIKFLDERVANTNYIMGVIVVVLFVGLLACLFAVFTMFQQAQLANKELGYKKSIDKQVDATNELKNTVNQLNSSIKNFKVTPTQ